MICTDMGCSFIFFFLVIRLKEPPYVLRNAGLQLGQLTLCCSFSKQNYCKTHIMMAMSLSCHRRNLGGSLDSTTQRCTQFVPLDHAWEKLCAPPSIVTVSGPSFDLKKKKILGARLSFVRLKKKYSWR